MSSEFSVEELVPHSGKMSLLDKIIDYGEGWLAAEVKINADSMFVEGNGVPAWIGLEYMAQGIAAYAGLKERRNGGKPKIGFLLGTRKYLCNAEYFETGQVLSLKVKLELLADNGLNVFACELSGKEVSATAVVNVFQPDDAEKFLEESTR